MDVNGAELAKILGISATTISQRVGEGMPVCAAPDGGETQREWRFDTVAVINWLIEQHDMTATEDPRAGAELRERVARAGLKELELGKRQKVLIHVDDIAPLVNEQFVPIGSRLRALPWRLAQQISAESDPAVCRRMLVDEVNQALEDISTALIPET